MNKEYAFKDENIVFVSNEKGELKEEKYTTNFNKVKIQENTVEEIENNLKKENNSKKQWLEQMESLIKLMKLMPFLGISAGFVLALMVSMLHWSFDILSCLGCILAGFGFASCGVVLNYTEYRIAKKHFNIAHFQSYFLKKDLERENKKLQELYEKSEPIQHKEENRIVQIDDKKELRQLKIYFELLRHYGEDLPNQLNLYANGLWEMQEKEDIEKVGLNADLFAQYLNEYNTRKLMKDKQVS